MRILEVTDFYFPWIAGPAPFIRNLSRGLADRGHEVVIACPSPTGERYDEPAIPRLHRVRTFPVPFGYKLRAGFPIVDMDRLVAAWQPDVIHFHHPFPISLSAVISAKARRVPLVATNHTIPECTLFGLQKTRLARPATGTLSAHIRLVLNLADAVTTPTPTAARMLADMGYRGNVTAISNGVDTERFYPSETDSSAEEVPTILYTGRVDADKDLETLIRALPRIFSSVNAQVRIGGEGTDRARLQRLVQQMGLTDRVAFTGYVSDEDLPGVYRQAAVYCMPSRVELQSISTLEAMASGMPIVAAAAGALPELVESHVNGLLIAPGDSEKLAKATIEILEDKKKTREYGAASRSIAESHSVDAMVSEYDRLLRDVSLSSAPRAAYGTARG